MNAFVPFDFGPGEVSHCSWEIVPDLPFSQQLWELRQDLIQVCYRSKNLVLDIGWSPDFNVEGRFIVAVVRGENWENPVFSREAFTFDKLRSCVEEAVKFIEQLS
jgi:hypothetical protein